MIYRLWQRFEGLNIWLKIIWTLCLCGFIFNTISLCKDLHTGGILFRLHLGFWILYGGQVVFILWGERLVFLLSLLQGVLALFSNLDLTFVPLVRIVGWFVYALHGTFAVEELEVYKYIFVSVCFTLEMWKTVVLLLLLRPLPSSTPSLTEE